jgi:gliding motility-associated-like protein
MKSYIYLLLFFLVSYTASAQVIGTRDCSTATGLCTNDAFNDTITAPPVGTPNWGFDDIPNGDGASCFNKRERRPFWYQFTAENDGTFEMYINNVDGGEVDWDWVLYDKTNGCGPNNWIERGCNSSEDYCNGTGISSDKSLEWVANCPGGSNPWANNIDLVAGRTYALLINGVDGGLGAIFNLSFGGDVVFRNIVADFTADPNPACFGRTINFTNTSTYPAGDIEFSWDFGDGTTATTENASHNYDAPGTYPVKLVVDNGFCKDSITIDVVIEDNDFATATATPSTICFGLTSQLLATGGGTYEWLPDASLSAENIDTPIASPTETTTYTVIVTDLIGCIDTAQVTVTVTFIDVDAGEDQDICFGESAPLTAEVFNGQTYTWQPGNIDGESIIVSPSDTTMYYVTVEDINGCINIDSVTVNVRPLPIVIASADPASICNGNSTQLDATPGLTTYLWSPSESLDDPEVQSPTATPNTTTTYTVIATDEFGCSNTDAIEVEVTYIAVSAGDDVTICNGGNTPLEASPQDGGETYSWTPATGLSQTNIFNPIASPSVTTDYVVEITDAAGCINTDTVTITVTYIPITISNDTTICFGGTATLTATGGVSYVWEPGTISEQTIDVSPSDTTTYYVTVTDDNGCINTDSVTVNVRLLPVVIASADPAIICNGNSTQLNATPGLTTYLWSPSESLDDPEVQSPTATPNTTTTYTVIATDEFGCSNTDEVEVEVTYIVVFAGNDQDICFGEEATLTAEVINGQTYTWQPGNIDGQIITVSPSDTTTYIVTVTDINGCMNTDTVTVNVKPLPTGYGIADPEEICLGQAVEVSAFFDTDFTPAATLAYSFDGGANFQNSNIFNIAEVNSDTTINMVILNDQGCFSEPFTVDITIRILDATVTQIDSITCHGLNDASVEIEVDGGNTGYLFSFEGSLFSTDFFYPNIAAGSYNIQVEDQNDGCIYNVPFSVTEPDLLVVGANITNTQPCLGTDNGEAVLNANGGTSPYLFSFEGSAYGSTTTFTDLAPGDYVIAVRDAKGCEDDGTATIIEIFPIQVAQIDATIVDNRCQGLADGSITLDESSINGGEAPYMYSLEGGTPQSTPFFENLQSGDYTITITDATGCEYIFPFTVFPYPLTFNPIFTVETCENEDGTITLTNPSGGTPGYTYSVDGINFGNDNHFTNLASGEYNVTLRDSENCRYTIPMTLTKKPGPVMFISPINITCHKFLDGMVIIDSVIGGEPFVNVGTGKQYFEFSIDSGFTWQTDTIFKGLPVGDHRLLIKDSECVYRGIFPYYVFNENTNQNDTLFNYYFSLFQPDTLAASAFGIPGIKKMSNGSIGIYDMTGGTSPYYYSADNSEFYLAESDTVYLNGYDRGYSIVYVKDRNGCLITTKAFVDVPMFIPNLITPNKDGANDRFEIISLPMNSELRIYNRWGNQVYKHTSYDNSWDGEGLADGIYYFDLVLPDKQLYKGWVNLVR